MITMKYIIAMIRPEKLDNVKKKRFRKLEHMD